MKYKTFLKLISSFFLNVYIVYLVMGSLLYNVCLLIHHTRLVIHNTPTSVRNKENYLAIRRMTEFKMLVIRSKC